MKPLRVYIAGKYNDDCEFKVFRNIRLGLEMSVKVFLTGHNPFCPWSDFYYKLMGNGDVKPERLYKMSIAWLRVSDAILMIPGWEDSKGAREEWNLANELEIPVYYCIEDLPEVDE